MHAERIIDYKHLDLLASAAVSAQGYWQNLCKLAIEIRVVCHTHKAMSHITTSDVTI